MTTPYTTGTITLTNGSAVVTGVGTAWQAALIVGGTIYVEADGNPLPILLVGSDTEIMAAIKWTGAGGTYPYAIMRDTAYGQQTVANANALSTYIQRLDNKALAALASIAGALGAGKVPRGVSTEAMEWFTVSEFAKSLLDDGNAAAALTTLGVSDFAKSILDDADAAAMCSTLGAIKKSGDTGIGALTGEKFALAADIFFALASGQPVLAFDTGDYIGFDRGTNRLTVNIGGVPVLVVQASGAQLPTPLLRTSSGGGGFHLSVASETYVIPASGAHILPNSSSGVVLITDHVSGSTGIYVCGGNAMTLAFQSGSSFGNGGAGSIGGSFDGTNGRYFLFNNSGASRTISYLYVKTRDFT